MDRMSFDHWIGELDRFLLSHYGVTHRDIADWTYRDAYDDGLTFREAAHRAINNEIF